jgi:hypothetical protein
MKRARTLFLFIVLCSLFVVGDFSRHALRSEPKIAIELEQHSLPEGARKSFYDGS